MNGVDVFLSAVAVRDPLAFAPPIVEIQHRGHGIDAQTINVILVQPEKSVGAQKVLDLVAAVIEHEGVPVRLLSLPRISVLIKMRSVEVSEPGFILGKMRRNPIQNYADSALMQIIYEVHEIGGRSKPACGSGVPRRLVSPRTVEGMLHDRKQFDMGETGVVDVSMPKRCQLTIAQPAVAFLRHAPPGAQVHLVNGNRRTEAILFCSARHPRIVMPGILV